METLKAIFTSSITWFALIPTLIVAIYFLKRYWSGYEDDNVVEEKVEEIIKDKTGIDVDLTPSSPEYPAVNIKPTSSDSAKS